MSVNCCWFADCVATWFAGVRTKAVNPTPKAEAMDFRKRKRRREVWMSFVCVCALFRKESFKVEIILIGTIKPYYHTFIPQVCTRRSSFLQWNALKLKNSSVNNFILDLPCMKLAVRLPDVFQKALCSEIHRLLQDIPLVFRDPTAVLAENYFLLIL